MQLGGRQALPLGVNFALGRLLGQGGVGGIQGLTDLRHPVAEFVHLRFGGGLGQSALYAIQHLLYLCDPIQIGTEFGPSHAGIDDTLDRVEMLADRRDLGAKLGADRVDRVHGDLTGGRVHAENSIPEITEIQVVAVDPLAQLLLHQGDVDVVLTKLVLGILELGFNVLLALVQRRQGPAQLRDRTLKARYRGNGGAQLLAQVLGADLPVQYIEDGGDIVAGTRRGGEQARLAIGIHRPQPDEILGVRPQALQGHERGNPRRVRQRHRYIYRVLNVAPPPFAQHPIIVTTGEQGTQSQRPVARLHLYPERHGRHGDHEVDRRHRRMGTGERHGAHQGDIVAGSQAVYTARLTGHLGRNYGDRGRILGQTLDDHLVVRHGPHVAPRQHPLQHLAKLLQLVPQQVWHGHTAGGQRRNLRARHRLANRISPEQRGILSQGQIHPAIEAE